MALALDARTKRSHLGRPRGTRPTRTNPATMDDATQDLHKLCERHGDILDEKESYGEGDTHTQARRYWLDNLAKPVIERAREKLRESGKLPKVDLLVSVAGMTPETTIITAAVFQPCEVLVISSDGLHENVDTIGDFLMKGGLRPSQFHHERCTAADMSLFEIICRRVKEHRQRRLGAGTEDLGEETLVDITGGKKVMSAGAAMAALELDLRICYVDNEFHKQRRVAIPGTESIVLLDSPFQHYGAAERRRADQDFDLGAYDVAHSRYEQLAEKLNEPARARLFRDVSAFYEAWRNLNIDGMKKSIPKVRDHLDEPVARKYREQLQSQLDFVERLVKEERAARVMTLFLLAEANLAQKRYDFSALLFYRTIEASIASRLEQRYKGFSCEKPNYALLDPDGEALRQKFEKARRDLFPKDKSQTVLPTPIACLDGTLLLRALDDELLKTSGYDQRGPASSLPGLFTSRNLSILAHGYQSVTEKNCTNLREPAERFLKAYWTLNNEPMPFEQAIERLRFLRVGTA